MSQARNGRIQGQTGVLQDHLGFNVAAPEPCWASGQDGCALSLWQVLQACITSDQVISKLLYLEAHRWCSQPSIRLGLVTRWPKVLPGKAGLTAGLEVVVEIAAGETVGTVETVDAAGAEDDLVVARTRKRNGCLAQS